jgi:hypothetical protein
MRHVWYLEDVERGKDFVDEESHAGFSGNFGQIFAEKDSIILDTDIRKASHIFSKDRRA